jgi:hypothetical protein
MMSRKWVSITAAQVLNPAGAWCPLWLEAVVCLHPLTRANLRSGRYQSECLDMRAIVHRCAMTRHRYANGDAGGPILAEFTSDSVFVGAHVSTRRRPPSGNMKRTRRFWKYA